MSIVSITKDEIKLFSGMSEAAFGKTNYASILSQPGFLFDGKEFSSWKFEDIRAEETALNNERQVVYCGKNPFEKASTTLLDYFENAGRSDSTQQSKQEMFEAGLSVIHALTVAAQNNQELPKIGAGAIIIEENSTQQSEIKYKNRKILFLPQGLVESAVAGLDEVNYSNIHGCWVNPSVFELPSLCFQRGVIAYKMVTGRFPYAASNLQERNSDILDQKFLPVELCVNGINPELAGHINKALKLNSNVVEIPGKKKKGKSSEDLTPTAHFPLYLLQTLPEELSSSQSKISDEEFQEKATKYLKAQNSKINAKRTIRRNITKISVIAITAVIVIILISNFIRTNGQNYNSRGLTSTQTLEALFMGINQKDTILLDNITKGRTAKQIANTVSQIYVLSKQRKTYSNDNGFASPENWLVFLKDESLIMQTGLYGVTNVRIDGKLCELNVELHQEREKIPPITEEKGMILTNKSQSVHTAEYFLLHSEGENNQPYVEFVTQTYTLSFINNRWIITDISGEYENVELDTSLFYMDYFQLLNKNTGDTIKTVEMLSIRYPWLPQKSLIQKEINSQKQLVSNPFPMF